MCDYWRMCFIGGALSGSIGVNGHVANGIAGLFLACGQDVACVSEATTGVTRLELTESGDLYCGLTLPNLIVGTVGGGTRLRRRAECLRILGCEGSGHGSELPRSARRRLSRARSIVGSLCAGDFASAHERLGRHGSGRA